MRKLLLSVIASMVLVLPAAANTAEAEALTIGQATLDRLDQYVGEYYRRNDVIGGIYGIVQQDRLIHASGYGTIRKGEETRPGMDTLYAIGSVTKPITSTAIYQLQEQGLLDLDQPVDTYIPWFRFKQADLSEQVTIRHLMNHAAGGVGSFQTDGLLAVHRDARDSLERYVRLFERIELAERPGISGNYCNGCIDALGLVIEYVSGMSYYEYMEQHIFQPLGMQETLFGNRLHMIASERVAAEYTWLFAGRVQLYRNFEAFGQAQDPDGGIYSTMADMAKYAAFQLGYGRTPLLSDASMSDSRTAFVATEAKDASYTAGGFETKELHGTPIYWKLGDGIGSGAALLLIPEYETAVILMNGEFHPELSLPIIEGAASILLGQEPAAIETPLTIFKLLGYIAIGLTVLGLLLLFLLVLAIVRKRAVPFKTGRTIAVLIVSAAVALPIGYLFLFVRPSAIGFYGYPYDAAIGLGLTAIAAACWMIRSVVVLAGRKRGMV